MNATQARPMHSRRIHGATRRRGFTLLEVIIYAALLAMVSVATLGCLAQARLARARARDRASLLAVALGAVERTKAAAAAGRPPVEGVSEPAAEPWWPAETSVTLTAARRPDGLTAIDVTAVRTTPEGAPPVRLATLISGGTK